jgi:arylsulfatase
MTPFLARLAPRVSVAAASLAALAASFLPAATSPQSRPNVIIIFADDMGYADVGCFGAEGIATPHLDRMAAEGRRFTNFHVPQPVCSASRAALLTGCYPNRIGIHMALAPGSKHGLGLDETTLPELLKQQSYATGMVGKWHLGSRKPLLPTYHGFDEFFGLPYSNDMWPHNPEAKPGVYPPLPLLEGETPVKTGLAPEDQDQLTTWYTERAVKFIEQNRARPFFLYFAHSMPHVPLHVSSKFRGKSARGLYGDVIQEMDWSVGEVLAALKRNGIDDRTLVIFTSDNGPWLRFGNHGGSAKPLREGKGTNWEGGTRVPCIMRWPGTLPAGTTTNVMAMTIDLLPTFARLTGAPLPTHAIDGLDVWPLLVGQPGATNPHEAYVYYFENNELQAVTDGEGRWKLQFPHVVRSLGDRPGGRDGLPVNYDMVRLKQTELFDLANDLGEKHNVIAQHPEVVRRLSAFAARMRHELGDGLAGLIGHSLREPSRVLGPNGK